MLEKRVQDIYYTAMVTLQQTNALTLNGGPIRKKPMICQILTSASGGQCSPRGQQNIYTCICKYFNKHQNVTFCYKLGPAVSCCLVQGQKNKKK